MPQALNTAAHRRRSAAAAVELGWRAVLAAAKAWPSGVSTPAATGASFAVGEGGDLEAVSPDHPNALLEAQSDGSWQSAATLDGPLRDFLDLYLPLCGGRHGRPVTVGHLGQSLDGFIATHSGESQWITGHENLLHMHRLRAICDAVIVGAGTVAADDPQLTTRLVPGPHPTRVVLDPGCRLDARYRLFSEPGPPTLYLCAREVRRNNPTAMGHAEIVAMDGTPERLEPAAVVHLLRERGCGSIFVEGGGVTVSSFLDARLLDRLHVTVAPLIIGDGRPAIRLPAPARLGSCERPPYRVFLMGGDVLFDCDVRSAPGTEPTPSTSGTSTAAITRVL